MTRAAAVFFHQAGGFQNLQMLRDGGPSHRQTRGQLADGSRPLTQQVQNRLAGGMRKRAQQLHSVSHD